jgi:hypothetical protein
VSRITQPPDTDAPQPFPERLRQALSPAGRGVIGVVEEVLRLCREQGLRLDWHANLCCVRLLDSEPQGVTAIPLPKSVFRAMLARVAALCNENGRNSVSPYGGQGELTVDDDPTTVIRVAFTNTPDEQKLELTPERKTN